MSNIRLCLLIFTNSLMDINYSNLFMDNPKIIDLRTSIKMT